MRTITRTWVALAFAAGVASPAAEAAPSPDTSRLPYGPFDWPGGARDDDLVEHVPRSLKLSPGERLVYEIKWSGMPAGRAVLSTKWKRDFAGVPAYHVESETRSNSFVSVFYPVEDKVISIIDAGGSFSRLFEMSKSEGRIRRNEHILFDYEKGLAVYEKRGAGPYAARTRSRVKIHGQVQDPLSCLYYLRTMELAPGARVKMPVHTARRSWPLVVEVLRREEVTLPGRGEVKALRVEPAMSFPGIFVRKGRMVVWIEEETHIPVLMHVDIPIGSVTVALTAAEGSPLKFSPPSEGAAPAE